MPGWPGCRRWYPSAGVVPGQTLLLTCFEGCSGTFLAPPSQVGSTSCPGLLASRGCLLTLGSEDGQFSVSRGFLMRRRSHFSFRSCGFRAMSFYREKSERPSIGGDSLTKDTYLEGGWSLADDFVYLEVVPQAGSLAGSQPPKAWTGEGP